MNCTKHSVIGLATLVLALAGGNARAQHGHLNAGALSANQGSQLYFANGDIFAASSGYVKDLIFTNGGRFAGFFEGGITLTALPGTTNNGGPVPNHPAFGSFIEAQIVSVAGPTNGSFGFWEGGATNPTLSMASGFSGGNARFSLSAGSLGAGQAGADPFGHLHGRRFTATEPGDYTVGLRLIDTSANGPGFGPIHAPSDAFSLQFRAIPEPSSLTLVGVGAAAIGWTWYRRTKPGRRKRAFKRRGLEGRRGLSGQETRSVNLAGQLNRFSP